jgi:glycosyltransferase involved in cell wall biosynthesis
VKDQNPLQVTVWMNYPSFYQGDMFRALIDSGQVDLEVVYAKSLTPDRLQLGWHDDLKGYPHRFINKRAPKLDAVRIARSQRHRIHIINGIWAEPSFAAALLTLALAGSKYVIYSEAPDPTVARAAVKRMLQERVGPLLAAEAMGVLPVSSLGFDFFKRLGVPEAAIFPFGYFRSRARWTDHSGYFKDEAKIEIVFAGQIIERKGLDILLDALGPVFDEYPSLTLSVIGDGDMLPRLRRLVQERLLTERVTFEGVIPPERIPARLAVADLLVLPSRWDGWGVVVNEAFSVGIPAVVSDRCGAADLIENGQNGYVFRSEDADALRTALRSFLSSKWEWSGFRARSIEVGDRISVEAVAPYLVDCLRHMTGALDRRPTAPWLSDERSLGMI